MLTLEAMTNLAFWHLEQERLASCYAHITYSGNDGHMQWFGCANCKIYETSTVIKKELTNGIV